MDEISFGPSAAIWAEFEWLNHCLNLRSLQGEPEESRKQKIEKLFASKKINEDEKQVLLSVSSYRELPPPKTESPEKDYYSHLVCNFNFAERFVFALGLAPSFRPELLDRFLPVTSDGSRTTAIGGTTSKGSFNGFIPTAQTVLFLLGSESPASYLEAAQLFDPGHEFSKQQLLHVDSSLPGEPWFSGKLIVTPEVVDKILLGHQRVPFFSSDFPARPISTEMNWDDLVLAPSTKRQIEEVKLWLRHHPALMNEYGMRKRLKPGNKILFHGPPGTGKTLTASLLGKYINRVVLRIDLSMIVNKYVGETEKNLARLFDRAQNADWILFFDEADALFANRTRVATSNDRFANQEVSYLLQRIEEHPGIVLLATNLKGQIDEAFMRRFNSSVFFSFPKAEERLRLWTNAFPVNMYKSPDVHLDQLSSKYELTGAQITNVVAWCALKALEKDDKIINNPMLLEGIGRELAKDGRTL